MTKTATKTELVSVTDLTKAERKALKQELELTKLALSVREAEADAEKAELLAEETRYDLEATRRREKRNAAQREVDNQYDFMVAISDGAVLDFQNWLLTRRLVAPGKPVTVNVYSPGGSVFAGFSMMDSMREARADGVEITVKISGFGASMAGIIAQAADVRLIGKDSWLMLHEISSGMFGSYKLSEMADERDFCERLSRQCDQWYADRSEGKWTVEAIATKTKKFDWWLNSAEALEAGFVDGVF